MNKLKALAVTSALLSSTIVASAATVARGADCTEPSQIVNAASPTSITFMGSDISREAMNALWDIVAPSPPTPHELLGRVVAADQDWLGVCGYPGIGIGAGSGWNADSKNVTLWFWATGVDLTQARQSIAVYIGAATTSTTSTTSTTLAPTATTTEPPVAVAVAAAKQEAPPSTTSTSTTTVAPAPYVHAVTIEPVAVSQVFAVKAASTTKHVVVKAKAKVKAKPKPKKVKCSRKQVVRRHKACR